MEIAASWRSAVQFGSLKHFEGKYCLEFAGLPQQL
jgi:hypothetical protein